MFRKKRKYHFDPDSLSIRQKKISAKEKLRTFIVQSLFGLILAAILCTLFSLFVDSPKEKSLKREILQYEMKLNHIDHELDVISKVLSDLEQRDDNIYRMMFGAEPIAKSVRNAGIGGSERHQTSKGYECSKQIIATSETLDQLSVRLYIQSKSFDELFHLAKTKKERMKHTPAILPVSKKHGRVSSGFGVRYHPILRYNRMHTGLDISAPKGSPIYATADAVVTSAGRSKSGYGIMVELNHGYGYKTLYGHMSTVKVKKGQKVKRGEIIGLVGNTGLSSAPHLHYEVIQNEKKVDPVFFFFNDLTPEEYEEVIEKANEPNQCLS